VKAKSIGNAGERNHRRMLSRVFPSIKIGPPRHPTDDHSNTEDWHIQSKKRATWNIKDVVRHMDHYLPEEKWIIMYEDRNRNLKDNPSGVYMILPAELGIDLLSTSEGSAKDAQHQDTDDAVQFTASDLTATDLVKLVYTRPDVDKIILEVLARRLRSGR